MQIDWMHRYTAVIVMFCVVLGPCTVYAALVPFAEEIFLSMKTNAPWSCREFGCPSGKVLETREGWVSLHLRGAFLLTRVTVDDQQQAEAKATKLLLDYFEGDNKCSARLSHGGQGWLETELIPTKAESQAADGEYHFGLHLPKHLQFYKAPIPSNPQIRIFRIQPSPIWVSAHITSPITKSEALERAAKLIDDLGYMDRKVNVHLHDFRWPEAPFSLKLDADKVVVQDAGDIHRNEQDDNEPVYEAIITVQLAYPSFQV